MSGYGKEKGVLKKQAQEVKRGEKVEKRKTNTILLYCIDYH
jgi:hypothetical protein